MYPHCRAAMENRLMGMGDGEGEDEVVHGQGNMET